MFPQTLCSLLKIVVISCKCFQSLFIHKSAYRLYSIVVVHCLYCYRDVFPRWQTCYFSLSHTLTHTHYFWPYPIHDISHDITWYPWYPNISHDIHNPFSLYPSNILTLRQHILFIPHLICYFQCHFQPDNRYRHGAWES